jgi:signal recognition particle subunit SRP54
MFENLSEKFERAFKVLKGQGQISDINVAETLKEVRKALLDADVNYKIAKQFTETVKTKALGQHVLTAISPFFHTPYERQTILPNSGKSDTLSLQP